MTEKRNLSITSAYDYISGLIFTFILIAFTISSYDGIFKTEQSADYTGFIFSIILAFLARAFAFRIPAGNYVSLDAAFYIAALINFKAIPTAWIAFFCLSFDKILRELYYYMRSDANEKLSFVKLFNYMIGSSPVALSLLITGIVFQSDEIYIQHHTEPEFTMLTLIPALAFFCLILSYGLFYFKLRLQGMKHRKIMNENVVPSINSEIMVIPIAILMVKLYDPNKLFGFIMLGSTYILVNFIFFQFSKVRQDLEIKLDELLLVNRLGTRLSSSLDLEKVSKALADEVLTSVQAAETFFTSVVNAKTERIRLDVWNGSGKVLFSGEISKNNGLIGWVLRHKCELFLEDIERQLPLYSNEMDMSKNFKSWQSGSFFAVPLSVYGGEVIGAIGMHSKGAGALDSQVGSSILRIVASQASIALQNAKLYEMATIDGMTGLYVKRYFDTRLADELARAKRYKSRFSLVLIEIDQFSKIRNDHGDAVAVKVLKELADITHKNMRAMDIPARFSNEEFALILPGSKINDGVLVAERILNDYRKHSITTDDKELKLSASFGVTAFPFDEMEVKSPIQLMKMADLSLKEAQKRGRNCVAGFEMALLETQDDS